MGILKKAQALGIARSCGWPNEARHTRPVNQDGEVFTGVNTLCSCTLGSLAQILLLAGGVIPPAPPVPASTRISDRLKRVQGHVTPVNT